MGKIAAFRAKRAVKEIAKDLYNMTPEKLRGKFDVAYREREVIGEAIPLSAERTNAMDKSRTLSKEGKKVVDSILKNPKESNYSLVPRGKNIVIIDVKMKKPIGFMFK